jgi:hypothetical protein
MDRLTFGYYTRYSTIQQFPKLKTFAYTYHDLSLTGIPPLPQISLTCKQLNHIIIKL